MWMTRYSKFSQWLPRKSRHGFALIGSLLIVIIFFKWKSGFGSHVFCSYKQYYNITNLQFANASLFPYIYYSNETKPSIMNKINLSLYTQYNNGKYYYFNITLEKKKILN